jgi:hypothetical protein
MGALQAQDFNMAKWAVGIRFPECTDKMVEAAFNKGEILRTHLMRPTWHFVAPENIRWLLSLTADKIKSSSRSRDRDLEITESVYHKSNQVIQKALAGHKHRTREDLGKELEKAKITVNTSRMVHFMMRAEVEGLVCSGALQGKTHTYALLDERVPPTKPLHREEALAKLAHIYFTAHCPATLQDFVWWSGLSQAEAKKGMDAVKSDFMTEMINGQSYWMADRFGKAACVAESALLLPAFDEYIISYKDRQEMIPLEHYCSAISSNGIFRPTIAVNGQVIGVWKKSTAQKSPVIFDFFEPNVSNRNEIDKATIAFCSFLGIKESDLSMCLSA